MGFIEKNKRTLAIVLGVLMGILAIIGFFLYGSFPLVLLVLYLANLYVTYQKDEWREEDNFIQVTLNGFGLIVALVYLKLPTFTFPLYLYYFYIVYVNIPSLRRYEK